MLTLRWGVVGVGRAGRARVEAIRADPRSKLVGAYRGDVVGANVPAFDSLTEMLQHVDAVAICSPDIFHGDQVHKCLSAHRHVVCEFPLASSAREASNLYGMALAKDRTLHVEHIGLLTPAAQWMKEMAQGQTLVGGTLRFNGGARSAIASPAHGNMARFHRIIDAVGVPDGVEVGRCTPNRLTATLRYPGEASITLECSMEEGQQRHIEMVLEFTEFILRQEDDALYQDGTLQEVPKSPGLFATDQLAATASILDASPSYVSTDQVLDALALADAIMGQA